MTRIPDPGHWLNPGSKLDSALDGIAFGDGETSGHAYRNHLRQFDRSEQMSRTKFRELAAQNNSWMSSWTPRRNSLHAAT